MDESFSPIVIGQKVELEGVADSRGEFFALLNQFPDLLPEYSLFLYEVCPDETVLSHEKRVQAIALLDRTADQRQVLRDISRLDDDGVDPKYKKLFNPEEIRELIGILDKVYERDFNTEKRLRELALSLLGNTHYKADVKTIDYGRLTDNAREALSKIVENNKLDVTVLLTYLIHATGLNPVENLAIYQFAMNIVGRRSVNARPKNNEIFEANLERINNWATKINWIGGMENQDHAVSAKILEIKDLITTMNNRATMADERRGLDKFYTIDPAGAVRLQKRIMTKVLELRQMLDPMKEEESI